MKLKNTSVYLLAGWMLAACSGGGFQKTENGVVVEVKQQQPTDVRKVRLEVMGEKLIHVSATPEKEFSKEQSLIVIPQQNKTDFKVEEQGDEVTVKTSELCAIVSKTTGEVRFTDATASRFWLKTLTGGPLLRWKWKVRKDIQYVRYSSRQAMMSFLWLGPAPGG